MEIIRYSIFQTQPPENAPDSWYISHNNGGGDQDVIFTANVEAAWAILTAKDGTGGYIEGNLVNRAVRILNDLEVDTYNIDPKYNFASMVALVLNVAVDPVSGTILT